MRVLVTGHNGYIGSVMVEVLRSAGHKVIGLDTYYFGDCDNDENDDIPTIRKDWSYRVSFDKLSRAFPDFSPEWNARKGAREVYEAVRQASLSLAEFQGCKFIRLNQLKHLLDSNVLDSTLRWRETDEATAGNG